MCCASRTTWEHKPPESNKSVLDLFGKAHCFLTPLADQHCLYLTFLCAS
jgi:hypothetical protein